MYNAFFHLKTNPFGETPNTRFFFKSKSHLAVLHELIGAVHAGKGFTLLTGEVGVGKTLISRLLLRLFEKSGDKGMPTALILNPVMNQLDLLATIRDEFKISAPATEGKEPSVKNLFDTLSKFLIENAKSGKRSVLIVDEAQRLSFEGLECIRLLSNLETDDRKLLQIILIGQTELKSRLGEFDLRQLDQRISVRLELKPLGLGELEFYIRHRIERSGGANFVRFDGDAVRLIMKNTAGVPRLVNLICERSLKAAGAAEQRLIDAKIVASVLQPTKPRWSELFRVRSPFRREIQT